MMKIVCLMMSIVMGCYCGDEISFMENGKVTNFSQFTTGWNTNGYKDTELNFDKIYFENAEKSSLRTEQKYMAKSIHQFAAKLDLAIRDTLGSSTTRDGHIRYPNVVYSPWSVVSIMSLLLLGASGLTHQEIATAMEINIKDFHSNYIPDSVQAEFAKVLQIVKNQLRNEGNIADLSDNISIGCGLFIQNGIPMNQRYLNVAKSAYPFCSEFQVPFAERPMQVQRFINNWVSNHTAGKIPDLLSEPLAEYTRLVLVNALYFKGDWSYPFPTEATMIKPFHLSSNEKVDTLMMTLTHDLPYGKSDDLRCSVVGLPYKFKNPDAKVTMYLIKPNDIGPESVINLLKRLQQRNALDNLISSTTIKDVILLLPKTKLDAAIPLVPALQNLGIKSLFEPTSANLHNMLNVTEVLNRRNSQQVDPLFVEDIRHRATLELHEKGTEAAAATAAVVTRAGSRITYRLDRPFIIIIRHHQTTVPIFWASIMHP